jgi:hypothetical protein
MPSDDNSSCDPLGYVSWKPVTNVIPLIEMKQLFKFQPIWWQNCGFVGFEVCYISYDLFIVTAEMFEEKNLG